MNTTNTINDIQQSINQYKAELASLQAEKKKYEEQVIIHKERLRQINEQLVHEFGTSDEIELQKIKTDLSENIKRLTDLYNSKVTENITQ